MGGKCACQCWHQQGRGRMHNWQLWRKSQQVPASLAHTLGLVNASPLKTVSVPFELLIFTLAPGLSESVHKPFKFSISYGLVVLLEISPIGFQGQMLCRLLFPLYVPRAGVSDVGDRPCAPLGQFPYYGILPCCRSPCLGFLIRLHLHLSYLSGCGPSVL